MSVENISLPYQGKDIYPSRTGTAERIIDRKDPVIYAKSTAVFPINPPISQRYRNPRFVGLEDAFNDGELKCFQTELHRLRCDENIKSFDGVIREPK